MLMVHMKNPLSDFTLVYKEVKQSASGQTYTRIKFLNQVNVNMEMVLWSLGPLIATLFYINVIYIMQS